MITFVHSLWLVVVMSTIPNLNAVTINGGLLRAWPNILGRGLPRQKVEQDRGDGENHSIGTIW